eukprot:1740517-Amphidinium_carterae.1
MDKGPSQTMRKSPQSSIISRGQLDNGMLRVNNTKTFAEVHQSNGSATTSIAPTVVQRMSKGQLEESTMRMSTT